MRHVFANLNVAVKEVAELTVKEFWKKFDISDAVKVIRDSWGEVQQKTMRDAWKKLFRFFFVEIKKTYGNCDSVSLLIDEIVENGRELNLKMDAENVVKLINSASLKLTINELTELKKQSTIKEIDEDFQPTERRF